MKQKYFRCRCGNLTDRQTSRGEYVCDRCFKLQNNMNTFHSPGDKREAPAQEPEAPEDKTIPTGPSQPGRLGILIEGPNRNYAL